MTTQYHNETNSLADFGMSGADYHAQFDHRCPVDWTTKGLTITRLRIVTDPYFPMWDVSYCHGELDGKPVHVQMPFSQIPKHYKGGINGFIIDQAKNDGVYAKGLGIFDAISKLW